MNERWQLDYAQRVRAQKLIERCASDPDFIEDVCYALIGHMDANEAAGQRIADLQEKQREEESE